MGFIKLFGILFIRNESASTIDRRRHQNYYYYCYYLLLSTSINGTTTVDVYVCIMIPDPADKHDLMTTVHYGECLFIHEGWTKTSTSSSRIVVVIMIMIKLNRRVGTSHIEQIILHERTNERTDARANYYSTTTTGSVGRRCCDKDNRNKNIITQ